MDTRDSTRRDAQNLPADPKRTTSQTNGTPNPGHISKVTSRPTKTLRPFYRTGAGRQQPSFGRLEARRRRRLTVDRSLGGSEHRSRAVAGTRTVSKNCVASVTSLFFVFFSRATRRPTRSPNTNEVRSEPPKKSFEKDACADKKVGSGRRWEGGREVHQGEKKKKKETRWVGPRRREGEGDEGGARRSFSWETRNTEDEGSAQKLTKKEQARGQAYPVAVT